MREAMQSEIGRHEERAFILKARVVRNNYAGQMLQRGCWEPRSFMMSWEGLEEYRWEAEEEVEKKECE